MSEAYGTKYEVMEEVLDGIRKLLEYLYQSGFDTVHDSTLKELEKSSETVGQYGLEYLSELLGEIGKEISMGRHRTVELRSMADKKALVAELYMKLNEYLYLGEQKVFHDRGMHYYGDLEEE